MVSRYFYDDNVTVDANDQCFAAKRSHFLDTVLAVMLLFPPPSKHGKYSERRKFHVCNDFRCTSFTDADTGVYLDTCTCIWMYFSISNVHMLLTAWDGIRRAM